MTHTNNIPTRLNTNNKLDPNVINHGKRDLQVALNQKLTREPSAKPIYLDRFNGQHTRISIKIGNKKLLLYRAKANSIRYIKNGKRYTVTFRNEDDFYRKIHTVLNSHFGKKRQNMSKTMKKVFNYLRLGTGTTAPVNVVKQPKKNNEVKNENVKKSKEKERVESTTLNLLKELKEKILLNDKSFALVKKLGISFETFKAIKPTIEKWKNQYLSGKRRPDLVSSYGRANEYIEDVKKIFKDAGFNEDIAYLLIAESHAILDAKSSANAVGPFQFTKFIASAYNLKITPEYDERKDPRLSAIAVIKHLKGTETRYHTSRNEIGINIAAYNSNMPNDLNKLRNHRRIKFDKNGKLMIVDRGQGTAIEKTDYVLYEKYLDYLQSNKKVKKQYLKESRDYLPKLIGIVQAIKEYEKEEKKPKTVPYLPVNSFRVKYPVKYMLHKIKSGDTLSTIAVKYKTTVNQIKRLNPQISKNVLKLNKSIKINIKQKPIYLKKIIRLCKISTTEFQKYNPAFSSKNIGQIDIAKINDFNINLPPRLGKKYKNLIMAYIAKNRDEKEMIANK